MKVLYASGSGSNVTVALIVVRQQALMMADDGDFPAAGKYLGGAFRTHSDVGTVPIQKHCRVE
jgi:hypothetical protein